MTPIGTKLKDGPGELKEGFENHPGRLEQACRNLFFGPQTKAGEIPDILPIFEKARIPFGYRFHVLPQSIGSMGSDRPRVKKRELLGHYIENPIDRTNDRFFLLRSYQIAIGRGGVRKNTVPEPGGKAMIQYQQTDLGIVGVGTRVQVVGTDIR
jgi:hypothetical protein